MGMFDHYEPVPPLEFQGEELSGWQGKDGPNNLLVWRQHCPSPLGRQVDEQWQLSPEELSKLRLSDGELKIYTDLPSNGRWFDATILVRDGVWVETRRMPQLDENE